MDPLPSAATLAPMAERANFEQVPFDQFYPESDQATGEIKPESYDAEGQSRKINTFYQSYVEIQRAMEDMKSLNRNASNRQSEKPNSEIEPEPYDAVEQSRRIDAYYQSYAAIGDAMRTMREQGL